MKYLNLILMVLSILTLLFCIHKLWKSPFVSAKRLCKFFGCVIFCIVFSVLAEFSDSSTFALVSFGGYFCFLDWMLYNLVYFCRDFCGKCSIQSKLKVLIPVILVVDNILFAGNIIFQNVFDVYTMGFAGEIYYQFHGLPLYHFHLIINYLLVVQCIVLLVNGIIKSPSFYKFKYVIILAVLVVVIIANGLYQGLHLPFDIANLLYAFIAFGFYYGPVKIVPERLIQQTLNRLVDKLENGIIMFDIDGKCVYTNSVIKSVFKTDKNTIHQVEPLCNWIDKDGNSSSKNYSEYFDFEVDGVKKNFKLFFNRITDENNKYMGSYYVIQNVTEETDRIKVEHQRATRDKLTGLYNRDYFCEKVEHRLKYDRFTGYYIVVSDIVNFKLINDLFGTSFGDEVLRRIAEELRINTNDNDIYGRLHNDHFVLLMPKRRFSKELFTDAFQKTFGYLNNFAYSLVCHIGVYEVEDRSIPVSIMCDRAFLALKKIKSDFTTNISFYDESLRQDVMKMQELMNELPLALKYKELVMYLQPQISTDEKLLGAEALVRWHHHEKGIISPSDFIQVIEKIGMISEVDMYVWEAACKKLSEWKKQGRTDLYISVNISPKDFYIVDVYEILTGLVKKYDISPGNLNLEITETAIIMDLERQIHLLNRLRDFGFVIEMDDFGSGYSSLNMLKDIDVDVLKIDMAFLKESIDDEKSRIILEKIIVLAKALGMKVVTEGVEKREQVDFLSGVGCDIYQGFYFSKPLTVSAFEEKFLKN